MDKKELELLIQDIVSQASELKNKHTDQANAHVHYCCIFTQSDEEFEALLGEVSEIGKMLKDTPTGPMFQIELTETIAGSLRILKIRKPDPTRPERGDADFAVSNYPKFKEKYLGQPGFKLIEREDFEMIELMDPDYDVRAYFSNPPVEEQYELK